MTDHSASYQPMHGRRVVYTGAAGGLGCETTLAMIDAGAYVFAIDNNRRKMEHLRSMASPAQSSRLEMVDLDLADEQALHRWLQETIATQAIDVVINNAAYYPYKPFEDFTPEELRLVHRVNVEAALQIIRETLPCMRSQKWGRIINIASITLSGGWHNMQPYIQSKGAMVATTRALAREFGQWGITVNAISPGAFPTDGEAIHPDPEGYNRMVLERQAIKRRGCPDDIASAIIFFASDEAGFITGQTLNVDGGWVMG